MPADPFGSAVHEVTRNLLTSAQQNARRGMWPRAIGHPALRAACLKQPTTIRVTTGMTATRTAIAEKREKYDHQWDDD
jgi:hypothetical protein